MNDSAFGEDYFKDGSVRQSRSLTRSVFQNEVLSWLNHKAPEVMKGGGRRALEIGCGYGYASEMIAELGYSVVGTDISEFAIERARQEVRVANVEFNVWDATIGRPAGQFDLIVAVEVIEHLADPEAALRNWARALTHGGVLVCTTPNKNGPLSRYKRDPTHINVRSAPAWQTTFSNAANWQELSIGSVQFVPWTWKIDGVMRVFSLPRWGSGLRILAVSK